MKKFLTVLLILSAVNTYASSSPNGVSLYFSTGYNPTGMGLTDFMDKPFYPNFNPGPPIMYQSAFGQGLLYPSMNSIDSLSKFKGTDSENTHSTGTALTGGLKFNFLTFLFLRSEFTFDTNTYLPIRYNGTFKSGLMWEPSYGSEVNYEFSYESMSVPLIFGFNIPIEMKGKYKADIYIAAGLSWTSARYVFSIDAPFGYVNDGATVGYSAFNEELEFKANTVGYTWVIGADYEIAKDLFLFFEVNSFIYNTVFSESKYKSFTMNMATLDGPKTQMDLTHTIAKIGVSYKFSSLVKDLFF